MTRAEIEALVRSVPWKCQVCGAPTNSTRILQANEWWHRDEPDYPVIAAALHAAWELEQAQPHFCEAQGFLDAAEARLEQETVYRKMAEEERDQLAGRVKELEEALAGFGMHASSCPEWAVTHAPKSLCNCGFDTALAAGDVMTRPVLVKRAERLWARIFNLASPVPTTGFDGERVRGIADEFAALEREIEARVWREAKQLITDSDDGTAAQLDLIDEAAARADALHSRRKAAP